MKKDHNFTGQTLWIQEGERTIHFINGTATTQAQANHILEFYEARGFTYLWKRAQRTPALLGRNVRQITHL